MACLHLGFQMQKLIIFILLCVIVYMMFGGESSHDSSVSSPPKTEMTDTQRETFKQHFKSTAERTTKDATWTDVNVFTVGVIDDGSNRDEYARYVCQALYRHGFKGQGVRVHVIDVMKRGSGPQWIKLGEADCDEPAK
jgi:hypothetical protein